MSETNLPKGCAVLNAEMAHVALLCLVQYYGHRLERLKRFRIIGIMVCRTHFIRLLLRMIIEITNRRRIQCYLEIASSFASLWRAYLIEK